MLGPEILFRFKIAADGAISFSGLPVELDSFLIARGATTCEEALPKGCRNRPVAYVCKFRNPYFESTSVLLTTGHFSFKSPSVLCKTRNSRC